MTEANEFNPKNDSVNTSIDRATPAVATLCDKYGDALNTLIGITLRARDMSEIDLGKSIKAMLPELRHELIMRHGIDVDKI